MSQLNQARDVALAWRSGTELVPVSVLGEMALAQQRVVALEERRAREQAATTAMHAVVRHHVSKYTARKRQAQAIAAVGAGLTALTVVFKSTAGETIYGVVAPQTLAYIVLVLGIATAVVGFLVWVFSARAQRMEILIEDATTAMRDRGTYYALIAEIERTSGDKLPWLSQDVPSVVRKWIAFEAQPKPTADSSNGDAAGGISLMNLGQRIGPHDFAKLLVASGLALDLLGEQTVRVNETPSVQYGFKPTALNIE